MAFPILRKNSCENKEIEQTFVGQATNVCLVLAGRDGGPAGIDRAARGVDSRTMRMTAAAAPAQPLRWIWSAAHGIREVAALVWAEKSPLLFGLRMWASVCLALYVAYWLELDNAYWAGTSAAIVCQPSLGASLRKASYRMVGTIVGAVAIVVLSAAFPQSRAAFLLGLALWGAICVLAATILRNFASYAAALAGFTAAIIAGDELGATGGTNGQVFMLALDRATEICIGIIAAGLVLAGPISAPRGGGSGRNSPVYWRR